MIKTIFHKSSALLLAFLVMLSTVSFAVEKHYCGDFLIDSAIFSKVEKCSNEALEKELEAITKKSCCKDTVDLIKGQDELHENSFNDLDHEQLVFIKTYFISFNNLLEHLPKLIIPHKDYSPPNLVYDLQLLDSTFLI